jgi:hypothetical protein
MATRRTDQTPTLRTLALLLGALLLAGCGSDSSIASGGIGGTGKGTISGYGSILINDENEYQLTGDTDLRVDGVPKTEQELRDMGTGLVATFVLAADADPLLLGGTALSVHVEHQLVGPITTAGPLLAVLGQRVLVNANTVIVCEVESCPAPDTLDVGEILRVSGYPTGDNHLLATRVEHVSTSPAEWKLIGRVTMPDSGSILSIGPQQVDITGITPADCGAALTTGEFVDIRAEASQNNPLDPAPLTGVLSVTCTTGGLVVPPGLGTGTVPALVEGVAEGVFPPWFFVSGQPVQLTDQVKYKGGEPEDLVDGVHVQVRGKLDVASGVLLAERVRFLMPTVRIVGPMNPTAQYLPDTSVTVLGITAAITPATVGTNSLDNLGANPSQVRVYGYVDSLGIVNATRVAALGLPKADSVDLRGPVSGFDGVGGTITILGVVVDTTGTGQFFGPTGGPLDQAGFFDALQTVTGIKQVSAAKGMYDERSSTITAPASVRIED